MICQNSWIEFSFTFSNFRSFISILLTNDIDHHHWPFLFTCTHHHNWWTSPLTWILLTITTDHHHWPLICFCMNNVSWGIVIIPVCCGFLDRFGYTRVWMALQRNQSGNEFVWPDTGLPVSTTVSSPFPVCAVCADNLTNTQQIPTKHRSWSIQKLYLSNFTVCRLLGLLCGNFAHTSHDNWAPSAVMMSVRGFDNVTVVYYDVTGVIFALQYEQRSRLWRYNGHELERQNSAHSSSRQTRWKYHVDCGRTFHRGDLDIFK